RIGDLKKSNLFPYEFNLPEAISFPEDFWKDVIKLYKDTVTDGLEREIALFLADGELVVTETKQGDEKSVKSNHTVSVKYTPHPTKREYFRKEVLIDNKLSKRREIYYKRAPKVVSVEYLFNMHTHPKTEYGFSFFSSQDLKSMIESNAVISGLITDKLWLLVRTDKADINDILNNEDLSVENLKEKMKFVVYCAEFNRKAIKQ
ncbi:MAG: hypothetical protein PHE21_04045, partial [Candidatus Dojkabacteria bacterium]|nr:hypothetical protein [Candidatus Dojkabacteria bacterium]